MNTSILQKIISACHNNEKLISVLIDPDNRNFEQLEYLLSLCDQKGVNYLLVGGSLLSEGNIGDTIAFIKTKTAIPVIIFPGTTHQISPLAEAILLLSLVSGRNPDLLIGKHVESAFRLKASGLEIIPTGYMLIDGGRATTASYISFTQPLPADKPMLAAATALAAEQLGLKLLYMDGGSGAAHAISPDTIRSVKSNTSLPLVVGGGLRTQADIQNAFDAGANMVVIGNALEINPSLLNELF